MLCRVTPQGEVEAEAAYFQVICSTVFEQCCIVRGCGRHVLVGRGKGPLLTRLRSVRLPPYGLTPELSFSTMVPHPYQFQISMGGAVGLYDGGPSPPGPCTTPQNAKWIERCQCSCTRVVIPVLYYPAVYRSADGIAALDIHYAWCRRRQCPWYSRTAVVLVKF